MARRRDRAVEPPVRSRTWWQLEHDARWAGLVLEAEERERLDRAVHRGASS